MFQPFQIYGRGFKILKIVPWTLTMPLVGYFVTREIGLAKIYPYTKFEVSRFTHSRFMEKGLKFQIWALTLLRVFCHG